MNNTLISLMLLKLLRARGNDHDLIKYNHPKLVDDKSYAERLSLSIRHSPNNTFINYVESFDTSPKFLHNLKKLDRDIISEYKTFSYKFFYIIMSIIVRKSFNGQVSTAKEFHDYINGNSMSWCLDVTDAFIDYSVEKYVNELNSPKFRYTKFGNYIEIGSGYRTLCLDIIRSNSFNRHRDIYDVFIKPLIGEV